MFSLVDRKLPLVGKVGSLVGGSDRIISKDSQSFEKLPLCGKVGSLVRGNDGIVSKDSQFFEELLSDRVELRNLALEYTLDDLLGKRGNSEGSVEISRGLRSDSNVDVALPLSLPSLTIEGNKSKKDGEAEIPTHLWLRWLNEGVSKIITMEEWNTFVPVVQETFLLLRWRRHVTSGFWEWFRKGSPSRPKEINLRRKLITWVDNKYVWEISGKTDHRREWKLLYVRSADLG